jgi:hypothetical protein
MGILLALRTTLLNPTLWVLAAVAVCAASAAWRSGTARGALAKAAAVAGRTPVLALLGVLAAGGLATRIGVGYLVPGSYAEEVISARSFLSERQLYRGNDRRDFERWLSEEPTPVSAWTLPGVTACEASAFESRPAFYTAQGHSPALLLASVPVVAVAGGRGLYVVLTLLSLLALAGIVRIAAREAGLRRGSVSWLVLVVTLAGWQPVLAGIRQGDPVLVVSALIFAAAWWIESGREGLAGAAVGTAGVLLPPALVLLVPVSLRSGRAALVGLLVVLAAAAGTLAVGGPLIFADYVSSTLATARLYVASPMGYSGMARLLAAGRDAAAWGALVLVAATTAAALRAASKRSRQGLRAIDPDGTLAAFAATAFLLVPVAWSQHVALLALPALVVSRHALRGNRPRVLAAAAGLLLVLSAPDVAVVWMGIGVRAVLGAAAAQAPPVPVCAAVVLWIWVVGLAVRPSPAAAIAAAPAAFQRAP